MRHAFPFRLLLGGVLALVASAGAARVTPEQAARLDADLTPVGAERAASASGAIPDWRGGLTQPPPCFKGPGSRYCDPFPEDAPLYTVTAENLKEHSAYLSPGQVALFERHPQTFRMPVYPTRRTFANPAFVYAATRENAVKADVGANGEALLDARIGVPFPIPSNAFEVMWNHRARYRDVSSQRWNNQFAVTAAGDFNQVKFREDRYSPYSHGGGTEGSTDKLLQQFIQLVVQPQRLAGAVLLVHEALDPVAEASRQWQYSPGQQRLRRAPAAGYDTLGTGADGLRTNDQIDTFSGGFDRYDWKLIGKRELLVPANSYRLHSDSLRYADIVKKGNLNPDYLRYELRRVWVVEALLRKNTVHPYRRRTFFLDEDGWQIRVVDLRDAREQLWRVQEAHTVVAYDKPYELPVAETVYDLQSNRYLVQALNSEDPETASVGFDDDHFRPSNATRLSNKFR
jgi:hypothetical protein